MKVFLSWSGKRSKLVAAALSELLPPILQPITCWMSEADLEKGKPWFDDLTKSLNTVIFGIVCVTPENAASPWMLWETGFLSSESKLSARHIAPLAIGMEKGRLAGPLAIYQGTDTSYDDMLRLFKDINGSLEPTRQVAANVLEISFNRFWPDLEQKIKSAVATSYTEKPVPPEPPDVQQTEILALLRQQQREGADLKALLERLDTSVNASALRTLGRLLRMQLERTQGIEQGAMIALERPGVLERTEALQQELERDLSVRRQRSLANMPKLRASLLEGLPREIPIDVEHTMGDMEASKFAAEIYDFLKANGFNLAYPALSQAVYQTPQKLVSLVRDTNPVRLIVGSA